MSGLGTRLDDLVRRSVIGVGPYVPGAGARELKARTGRTDLIRLNWNENLEGPLDGVLEAVAADLPGSVWAYPEEAYEDFRRAVAEWTGACAKQVIPGHGIQALTLSLVAATVEPGDRVVVPRPTYGLYASACGVAGAEVIRVDADPDTLALDLESLASTAARTSAKLVFVCDPNNPTGLRISAPEWEAFLEALPDRCLAVVDEAYADYMEPHERLDRLAAIDSGRPVVVLRTFSKIFGLAGLRLGYMLVHESLAPLLHAVQEPFNVNCAALAAGQASLERVDRLPARRRRAQLARARLTAPLAAAGITTFESHASFVLARVGGDDVAICEALAHEGLLLRAGSEFALPGHVRITLGDVELMDRVGAALARVAAAHRDRQH
ncbi:MAG TPA: histidinol-phosphate transaminase [Solirubrobacteraceae bacterium]|nr:histidinol-phosphate transaminase [Solirubrobacteraceae bacterium]